MIGFAAAPDSASAQQCSGSEATLTEPRFKIITVSSLGFDSQEDEWRPDPDAQGTVGINNRGAVVFAERDGDSVEAWIWVPRTMYGLTPGRHDLPIAGTLSSAIAHDINSDGVIVGQGITAGSVPSAASGGGLGIIWNMAGTPSTQIIDTVGGTAVQRLAVRAINEAGTIAGTFYSGDLRDCWCGEGEIDGYVQLGFVGSSPVVLPPGSEERTQTDARDISDNEDIAGIVSCGGGSTLPAPGNECDNGSHSCTEDWTVPASLSIGGAVRLPDHTSTGLLAEAYGVNNAGRFVGRENWVGATCPPHALTWMTESSDACALPLPALQTGDAARAQAVNNAAPTQIAGWNTDFFSGLLWEEQSTNNWLVTDLDAAIDDTTNWGGLRAQAVNDAGWIAGWGVRTDINETTAFVLVEIPECTCPGDANGDCTVDIYDLLEIVKPEYWETACIMAGPPVCLGDSDGNSFVDVFDILKTLEEWGPCGGGQSPSFESELMAVGLPHTADDEYINVLMNGTQAEIENYNCWIDHYLMECGVFCQHNCPDNDPWGKH